MKDFKVIVAKRPKFDPKKVAKMAKRGVGKKGAKIDSKRPKTSKGKKSHSY